jgi:crotonobetainyl-CoA:carnitine CoA-transferase CaiB-like acyl-CoA transferase
VLEPYTVLDFTDERGEIGPMILGDLGAEVIKVELPGGASSRRAAPFQGAKEQPGSRATGDLSSLQFVAYNRNKRSIVINPADDDDRATLEELIRRADILFESAPRGILDELAIDFNKASALNPNIVHVRLSPFGSTGPHAAFHGNDLVIAAMGGPVALQGPIDRAPVRISVPQVWRHAGIEAASGALVALTRTRRTGGAQFVDLSAQSVMTWTMLNAMDAHAIQGFDFERGGSTINNGQLKMELVYPTSDGWIVALPTSAVLAGCLEWMIADGVADAAYREVDWQNYDLNIRELDNKPINLYQAQELLAAFLCLHTKQELFEFGLSNGVTLAPINTLDELLSLDHIQTRDYWHDLTVTDNQGTDKVINTPGLWAKPSAYNLSIRHSAPTLGQHNDEIRSELTKPAKSKEPVGDEDVLPFAGLKVTDFAWVGVGPISSKFLADHGASVVRVESELRPDVLRANGPYKDNVEGWNRSQFFGDFNTSKQSLALDLKQPEAIEIAKQLISESDVMIESFAPGAILRMGLGYEEVRKLNPKLIMISTCLMGQTGPAAEMAGFGYHAAAIAGFYEMTGWPDRSPIGPWIAYTDTIAPRFISALLSAALDHRRRTGEGCFIDVAQIETALHFLAPELLDLQTNGHLANRAGNRSAYAAPQSCYPCSGDDNWCAIAVDTDDQWQALCRTLGRTDWAEDPGLASNAGRLQAHERLDESIQAWTHDKDATDVMNLLQAAGVPAGKVQRSSDLLQDPQYQHREFYRYFDHQEMGNIPYAGHQYRISSYDNSPQGPAPCLGQHSFEVLSEVMNLPDEDIAQAYAAGIIT